MITTTRIGYGKTTSVALPAFNTVECLKSEGIRDAQYIADNPDDEDNAWSIKVEERGDTNTTVLIIDPNGDLIRYVGPTAKWEG